MTDHAEKLADLRERLQLGSAYASSTAVMYEAAEAIFKLEHDNTAQQAELVQLREALDKSEGALCMLVGDMRDKGFRLTEAVLQEILDRNRAALTRSHP